MRTLAFDLGGTRLKAGLVDSISGEVEHFGVANVAGADAETALNRMAELADNLATMDAEALEAVGLAVPGLVAPPGRVVALPGKLAGIIGRDLSTELSTRDRKSVV